MYANPILQTEMIPQFLINITAEIQNPPKENFDYIFLETLDEVFSSLGETCKQAIYRQLNDKYGINKHALPNNIKAFTDAIEQIFGNGSHFLETKIMHILHTKVQNFKYYPEKDALIFSTYLEKLRNHLISD